MEPTKKSGFVALMDALKEDSLIRLITELLQDISLSCDEISNDAVKIEMALRRLLKRFDEIAPSDMSADEPETFA